MIYIFRYYASTPHPKRSAVSVIASLALIIMFVDISFRPLLPSFLLSINLSIVRCVCEEMRKGRWIGDTRLCPLSSNFSSLSCSSPMKNNESQPSHRASFSQKKKTFEWIVVEENCWAWFTCHLAILAVIVKREWSSNEKLGYAQHPVGRNTLSNTHTTWKTEFETNELQICYLLKGAWFG